MTTVDWKFYLNRKSIEMNRFLSKVTTLEGAYDLFDSKSLTRPPEDLILEVLDQNLKDRAVKDLAKTNPKPTTPRKRKASTSKPKNEKKDEKYFRKVLPKKK